MLSIDENKVVPRRFGDAGDVARARDARDHPERNLVGFKKFFHCVLHQWCICHFFSPGM